MLEAAVSNAPVFLLAACRCLALILTLPLFSSRTVPRMAKIALAGYMAYFIFPHISLSSGAYSGYSAYISPSGNFTLDYVFLLAGEAMIGIITGLIIQVIFAAFSTAGQFFAFQMGLSASEVYDSLSQVENPLMGQFFNFMAMLIFLQNRWLQQLFLYGLTESFRAVNAFSIVSSTGFMAEFMMSSLTLLFKDALIIALPIMSSLFLINVSVGILSKAAPQMNLLSEGFPILMLTAFFLISVLVPQFWRFFERCFADGFGLIEKMIMRLGGAVP
ncbi:MAG: flagellar biosynthetic protein FliR [Treponema sp.]|nr:flagellar biosynthetic protein FliR [Treponema sp.]